MTSNELSDQAAPQTGQRAGQAAPQAGAQNEPQHETPTGPQPEPRTEQRSEPRTGSRHWHPDEPQHRDPGRPRAGFHGEPPPKPVAGPPAAAHRPAGSTAVPQALAAVTGYLLHRAGQRAEEVGLRYVPPGDHPRDVAILSMLSTGAPGSQLDLANRMRINRTIMVRLIEDLERRGLVQRRRNPTDRRRYVLELTEDGRARAALLQDALGQADDEYTAALTDAETAELRGLLEPLARQYLDPATPPELRQRTAFLVVHVHKRLRERAEEALAGRQLALPQWTVLAVLSELGAVSQQRIATELSISGATVVELIDNLESRDRVQRLRRTTDRRAYDLTLTEDGRQTLAETTRLLHQVTVEATAPIGPAGRQRLNALLIRLIES